MRSAGMLVMDGLASSRLGACTRSPKGWSIMGESPQNLSVRRYSHQFRFYFKPVGILKMGY